MASPCRFRKLRPRSLVAGSELPAHWLESLEEKDGSREAETSDETGEGVAQAALRQAAREAQGRRPRASVKSPYRYLRAMFSAETRSFGSFSPS